MTGFPVLMYHALSTHPDRESYVLTCDAFRRHMAALARLGKRGVSMEDMLSGGDADSRAVVISFDDGHVTNKTLALPILQEFGFRATFFITTGNIGDGATWLTWDDAIQLQKAGMDMQAHGHTHRFIDGMPESEQRDEIRKPAELLNARLGAGRRHFSFPGGRYTAAALEFAREAGYGVLCTSEPGLNGPLAGAPAQLARRYTIQQRTSMASLEKMAQRDATFAGIELGKYRAKRLAKRVLGNGAYHRIWGVLHHSKSKA